MRAAGSKLDNRKGASADRKWQKKMDIALEDNRVVGPVLPGTSITRQQGIITEENIFENKDTNYIIKQVDDNAGNSRKNREGDARQDFPVPYYKKRGSSGVTLAIAANPSRLHEAVNEKKNLTHPADKAFWQRCDLCGCHARVPYSRCNYCGDQPSYHHGRCCWENPGRAAHSLMTGLCHSHSPPGSSAEAIASAETRTQEEPKVKFDKAPELRLSWLSWDAKIFTDLQAVGGPDRYVVAFFWFLREIEVAALMVTPQEIIVEKNGDVCLVFPVSKADKKGRSVRRALACICWRGEREEQRAQDVCGVCAVKRQLGRLEQIFEYKWQELAPGDSGTRLFLNSDGLTASKQDMTLSGTTCGGGFAEARGHTPHRSCTNAPARLGWPFWCIQSLARHSSNAFLGYVKESLAERSGDWTKDPTLLQSTAGEELCADTAVLKRLDKVEQALADIRSTSDTLKGDIDKLEKEFEVSTLATEEFNNFCKDKLKLLEEEKVGTKEDKKEMRVISDNGHFEDKLARTYRVVPGSTSLSRPACHTCFPEFRCRAEQPGQTKAAPTSIRSS